MAHFRLSAATSPAHTERPPAILPALVTTTAVQTLSTATALVLTGIAPLVAGDFGLSAHWVGYQISVIYSSGMLASACAGTLIGRFGPVRIEQLALACYALALGLLTCANTWLALAGSLIIGVGYGVQNPASAQILGAVTPPHRRSLIFSIKQAGVPLGGVLASLLYPVLAPLIGWRVALAITAVPCLALLVLLGRHAGPRPGGRRAVLAPGLKANFLAEQRLVWGDRRLRVLAMLGMLYSSLQLSLSAFAVSMLVDHGWTLLQAGGVAGAMQACGAVGRICWGGVGDRFGGFRVLALIGFVAFGCMLALGRLDVLPGAVQVGILCLFGFTMSGWNGVLMAESTHYCAPEDAGRVIGGSLVYTFLGVILGPSVMAALYTFTGDYGVTFAGLSLVAILGAVMAALTVRHGARYESRT
ncbi:MFS transporter [Novosphingobium profundi]|nr:MFS transporter [Novosphingobium profundi]